MYKNSDTLYEPQPVVPSVRGAGFRYVIRPLFLLLFLLSIWPWRGAFAQEPASGTLHLFINCDFCDMRFLRDQLNYVDHVRDQAQADVMVQINRVTNASGGRTYDLRFIGRERYEDILQELELNTSPIYTPDEVRQALRQRIELGLVP